MTLWSLRECRLPGVSPSSASGATLTLLAPARWFRRLGRSGYLGGGGHAPNRSIRTPKKPWNAGRIIGPKAPLKPKHIWAIRQQLRANGRLRDLAMFNCTIDAKLRACDLVRLTVSDVAPGGVLRSRSTVIQQKTGRPVPFRSPNRRARRWRHGCRFEAAVLMTGCFRAAAVMVTTSRHGSTRGWSTVESNSWISNPALTGRTACAGPR